MKLTDADCSFLAAAASSRIQHHYEIHHSATQKDRKRLVELEQSYQAVLARLCPDDADAIRAFHDQCFTMGADAERMLFRAGVLDGLRLAKLILLDLE